MFVIKIVCEGPWGIMEGFVRASSEDNVMLVQAKDASTFYHKSIATFFGEYALENISKRLPGKLSFDIL